MFIVMTAEQAAKVKCKTLEPIQYGDVFILGVEVLTDTEHPQEVRDYLATLPQEEYKVREKE